MSRERTIDARIKDLETKIVELRRRRGLHYCLFTCADGRLYGPAAPVAEFKSRRAALMFAREEGVTLFSDCKSRKSAFAVAGRRFEGMGGKRR